MKYSMNIIFLIVYLCVAYLNYSVVFIYNTNRKINSSSQKLQETTRN
jgi:hypothetical protein